MRRRDVIVGLGSAASAPTWSHAARAQRPTLPLIGFIASGPPDDLTRYGTAFRRGLSETGFNEGSNVMVEYHWLDGQYDLVPSLVADLIRRHVAVIALPGTTAAAPVARAATTTIPIIFGVADDPVKLGLVASLARPGGNATGVNFFSRRLPPSG
jgi:ABC-type uncharacterized transport system substrate-binding protein